jgi:hypothetical protein
MPRRTKFGRVLDAIAKLEAEKNEESDDDA